MEKKDKNLDVFNEFTRKLMLDLTNEANENIVFSSFSAIVLLAMLADATAGETRDEIIKSLGVEDSDMLTEWVRSVQKRLAECEELISSNAMCVREDFATRLVTGYKEHLKETFDGELFASEDLITDVNEWVNEHTRGMIPTIMDESNRGTLFALINAMAFEAKWAVQYESDDLDIDEFRNSDGSFSDVNMMHSRERNYIEDQYFTGFVKPYKNGNYSFMALLPKKEGNDHLKEAIGAIDLVTLFKSKTDEEVITYIPEYKTDYGKELTEFCKKIGINTVFSAEADFSPLSKEWLMAQSMIQKSFIQVDRNGTKAAAVTAVMVGAGCFLDMPQPKVVTLDRPFVYAIVHNDTGLPIFIGVVNHLDEIGEV